jgi:hypothetical protein
MLELYVEHDSVISSATPVGTTSGLEITGGMILGMVGSPSRRVCCELVDVEALVALTLFPTQQLE